MRRIALLVLGMAIGCGGKGQAPDSTEPVAAPSGDQTAQPAAAPLSGDALVGAACDKMNDVHGRTPCEFLTRARFSPQGCRSEMSIEKIPEKLRPAFETAMRCITESNQCEGFPRCFAAFNEAAAESGDGRACGEQGIGPVTLSADEAKKRYGQGVTKLSEAPTALDKPVEVCGVAAQHQWLEKARCDDGSTPLSAPDAARDARAGSVGIGGRCASMIDRYVVKCPEKTYEVFMDLYMCGPGESI